MRVDQAGENGFARQVDDRGAGVCGCAQVRTDAHDLAVLNDYGLIGQGLAGADIEKFSGAYDGA